MRVPRTKSIEQSMRDTEEPERERRSRRGGVAR
jgi:hypothetical protein